MGIFIIFRKWDVWDIPVSFEEENFRKIINSVNFKNLKIIKIGGIFNGL
jgi:hypothetical protein